MKRTIPYSFLLVLLFFSLSVVRLFAQPATVDKNKNKDPMIMQPGYIMPANDQLESTVITIDDYDNFKLGVDFAECSIAGNPLNPLQYYAVWNSSGTAGGKGYYTNDGYTWTAGNPNWTGMWGDVVVTYDSLGHLAYQNMYGSSNVQGTKVAMSSNNGQSWDSPVTSMSGSDKNWMFADQTAGPYANYIYGTMTNTAGSGQSYSRTIDLGATWTSPTSFNPGGAIPGTSVCVGPDGNTSGGAVYVVTNSGSSFSSTYTFYKSTNGGSTFAMKSAQQFSNTVGTQVGGRNAVLNMRTRPYPFIACDNSFGPHRGRLYLVYASNNPTGNGNKPDIFCRYSDDGASTWSSAKVVNDDPNSQSNHNWFPAVWCEKNTGRLYISWMDTRDTPTSDSCMIYASYTDDGVTFAPNKRISNKKMKINCTSCGGGGTPMYLGDYNGIAANKVTSLLAWTDFRENSFGSYVAYFPDFGLRATPAIDTLSPVATINAMVPSVKAYQDTVVVSATISGNPGLFTISYPNGNKLWSYPGSVPIQISQNGSVPLGDYTLNIVATGSNGTPVHKRTATVRALTPVAPTANFIVNDTSACVGQPLNFTDVSAGPPTSWDWSFPGGTPSTSNVQNPSGIVYNEPGQYDVTLTVTNQSGSNSITLSNYVHVYPVPEIPLGTDQVACFGQTVPDLTADGTGLKWYKGNLLVGNGNSFATGQTQPGTYNYSITQTVHGCESAKGGVTLTINPLPIVSFIMADSICGNTPAFNLTGGDPVGGVYSGAGVSTNGLSFDPTTLAPNNYTLTYTYTDVNGCSDSAFHIISVSPVPTVTFDALAPVCSNAAAITLNGTPAGGTFTGTAVSGNIFDPAVSGAGDFTLSYTYQDPVTHCLITSSQVMKVNPLPTIAVNDTSLCGNRVLLLDATSPNISTYLWTPGNLTTPAISVDTIGKGLGVLNYTIALTDANSCAATKSFKVTFFDCTGLEEAANSTEIEIYPNPNQGLFEIRSNSLPDGKYSIKVYNVQSKVVYSDDNLIVNGELHKTMNIKNLSNGMYLLRIENTTSGWSKQVLINR
ncbi:MAG: PKD domain-containing protein [Bacteroidetes bacterium]|nr:PKD domain-containing protein [Bacteroidota bacterium]